MLSSALLRGFIISTVCSRLLTEALAEVRRSDWRAALTHPSVEGPEGSTSDPSERTMTSPSGAAARTSSWLLEVGCLLMEACTAGTDVTRRHLSLPPFFLGSLRLKRRESVGAKPLTMEAPRGPFRKSATQLPISSPNLRRALCSLTLNH